MAGDSWFLHPDDGQEIMSFPWALISVAEGEVWRTMVGGARLPAALLVQKDKRTFTSMCIEENPQIRASSNWREEHPRKMCLLWLNERITGMRLLEAERRDGPNFLSQSPIIEKTPQGWRRTGFQSDELEQA
jgi:hypothetical protein